MNNQILEEKQEQKEEPAIVIVPPKESVKEMLTELKKLKSRKDDLLFPIKDELEEIEDKAKKLADEIEITMQEVKETVFTNDAKAVWKLMPKPRLMYDTKALDSITDEKIREVLDTCKKYTQQGNPKVKIEVW